MPTRLSPIQQSRFPHRFDAIIAGLMHPAVITLGKRGESSVDIQHSESTLHERGIEVVQADRGGQATLHSPGQLVIYPILPLRSLGLGARAYVELLESTTLAFLSQYGIRARRPEGCSGPGLYTQSGKIAFFGVRIRSGVTLHGISINVSNDLVDFAAIRSCGRSGEAFDRLRDHGIKDSCETAFAHWVQAFKEHLRQKKVVCTPTDS